jgi:hypothetical protein
MDAAIAGCTLVVASAGYDELCAKLRCTTMLARKLWFPGGWGEALAWYDGAMWSSGINGGTEGNNCQPTVQFTDTARHGRSHCWLHIGRCECWLR